MWKPRREDEKPSTSLKPEPPTIVIPAPPPHAADTAEKPKPATPSYAANTVEKPKMDTYRADVAHIGKSVIIKGELSGSEDLYLDGEVEGNIDLHNHNLVIGPNGQVRANVQAKDVVIHGKVDGNVTGDKVELKKSALLTGDIDTQRIVIEDGAFFKGAIDIRKPESKAEPKVESARPAVQAASASVTYTAPVASPSASTEKK